MFKKAKLYSLLAIIIVSTAISLSNFSQTANAQNSTDVIDSTLLAEAKSTLYQRLMYQCLNKYNKSGDIFPPTEMVVRTVEEFKEGDLIGTTYNTSSTDSSDSGWRAGYIVDPSDDGKLSCHGSDGNKIIEEYKKATGYTAPAEYQGNSLATFHFLCTLGFRPLDEYDQFINTDAEMPIKDCVEAATNQIGEDKQSYGLYENKVKNPEFDSAMQYVAYRYTLINRCGAKLPEDGTQQNNRYPVMMINMDGSGKDTPVDYILPNNDDVTVFLGTKVKCRDIPAKMAETADAYITYRKDPRNSGNQGTSIIDIAASVGGGSDKSTCRVDGIGWIICPIVNLMARLVDDSYILLDSSLLRVAPVKVGDADNSLYKSWKMMRDFANIAFVIAFLIIVFSQITSFGVSNYGIKRLLPKLVIAAIMVNLSYYICAFAVDISNILGSSLKDLLDRAASRVSTESSGGNAFSSGGGVSGFMGWAAISTGILIAVGLNGGWLAALALLVPLLLTALGAVVAVVVTLILRQVLIILLIVISPLAFVALLLPNTEDYFKKWRTVFQTLLLLYPIIAVVFGASALASAIIMGAAEAAPVDGPAAEGLGGITQTLMQLTGAAASVIPLFIVPTLVKLAGGALNRFAGVVNDPSKGWIDNKRNAAQERQQILKAKGIQRQGRWAGSAAGRKVLGREGSKRRRAFGAVTAFGANNRDLTRKDELAEADSIREGTYLNTEAGQAARSAAANAKIAVQNAQMQVDTVQANSAEGLRLQIEGAKLGLEKQTAEDKSQAIASSSLTAATAGRDLLTQAKQAELQKQVAETGVTAFQSGQSIEDITMQRLAQEKQRNQAAAGVAQGVETRRFNKDMADGTVDVAKPLGPAATGASAGEIHKATSAAITEAGEKEVRKEQQALSEDLASAIARGIDPDDVMRARATSATDPYELSAVFNEMARRGRDGLITEEREKHALNTPEREMLEEAVQSNGDKLVGKAPHMVKGEAALDNVNGSQMSGYSKHAMVAQIERINNLYNSGQVAKADAVAERFNKALDDISKDPAAKQRFDQDAGKWALELISTGVHPRTGKPVTLNPRLGTALGGGTGKIDPNTGGLR